MDKALKIAVTLSAYDKMSTVINQAVNKAQTKLAGLKKGLNGFGNVAAIGGGVATAFFASTLGAAEENEIAVKRLEQVYRSMGQNVGEASKKSQAYASQLEMQIGVEDEAIMAVQAKFATFSKISDDVARDSGKMDRATAAAFDLQATGMGEASGNAVMLGKALQDPARGAMALSRAGALNKGDIPIIKQIQASKGLVAAQEYVLQAVEKQVKGVAAATAPATAKMKVAFSEVTESIGKALLPTITGLADFIGGTIVPKIQAFTDAHPGLIKALAAASVALLVVGTSAKILALILDTNPIVLIITAIAAAAYLIYDNWGAISKFFGDVWDSVTAVFNQAIDFVKNLFLDFTPIGLIIKHWSGISSFFSRIWNIVKLVFNIALQWIKHLLIEYTPIGLIYKHWEGISTWFSTLWDNVKKIFSAVWEGIKSFLLDYTPLGLIYKHWDEIVSYFTNIWDKVKKVFQDAWASIKNGLTSFFSIGGEADSALSNFESTLKKMDRNTSIAFNGNTSGALSPGTPFQSSSSLKPVSNNSSMVKFAPVINYTGTGSPQDVAAFGTMVQDDFSRRMENYNQQKTRKSF